MKKTALICLFALSVTGLLPGQQPVDRFGGIKPKIQALLGQRLKPEPLPPKPANPFQYASAVTATTTPAESTQTPTVTPPTALTDDDQILAYCVSRLRITGQVLRGGVAHLLINSATYRESDLVPVHATGDAVYYVRIAHIGENEVSFAYNDASVTVRLP